MFKRLSITLLLITSVLFASLALAGDPLDPSIGENIIPAGGVGVVTVLVSSGSAGGIWVDFSSDDGGSLDLLLISKNGGPVKPAACGISNGEGEHYSFLFNNTTESPIDVTVTMNFETGSLACPPQ